MAANIPLNAFCISKGTVAAMFILPINLLSRYTTFLLNPDASENTVTLNNTFIDIPWISSFTDSLHILLYPVTPHLISNLTLFSLGFHFCHYHPEEQTWFQITIPFYFISNSVSQSVFISTLLQMFTLQQAVQWSEMCSRTTNLFLIAQHFMKVHTGHWLLIALISPTLIKSIENRKTHSQLLWTQGSILINSGLISHTDGGAGMPGHVCALA